MQNQTQTATTPGPTTAGPGCCVGARGEGVWRRVRVISGAFVLIVSLIMVAGHLKSGAIDPLKSPELAQLKAKLRQNPTDESTKAEIRRLDLSLRTSYFRRLSRSSSGVYLLFAGVALFIVSSTRCAAYKKQPPMPKNANVAIDPRKISKAARWSVSAAGVIVSVGLWLLSLGRGTALTETSGSAQVAGAPHPTPNASAPDAASDDELNRNWPRFRGPGGNGISTVSDLPTSWDVKSGQGIAWKTPVPAPGFNSPIIWGNNFYFSGGDANNREVFCYDCAKGQQVWRQKVTNVPGSPAKAPEIPETTGYAASSMATDGRRVYVIFATGEVAAFTLDGKWVWAKDFGPLKNPYGYASSLLTWRDRLILLLDQGESEEGKSRLYALDGRTGQIVWQTPRKVGSSWATPISFEAAGQAQVVALSLPWAISYRLADGVELWRVECLSGEVTPSPVFGNGLVLVPSPSEKLLAIRPDGQGDVTKTKVAWSTEENVPDVTSPVSNGELVFTLTTPGLLTCFDNKDGKKLWEHDFELECHSSPAIAGNRLYVFAQKGTAVVTAAAREFKELFRAEMPDVFHASPAFTQNMIILRGTTNLWGLASAPK